ncbi:MAG: phage antirepressor KilAC domain-containing protein [Pseudomonadota bacterium]
MNQESHPVQPSAMAFNFGDYGVRTMLIGGEPYFAGRDVADALGYAKPQNAISTHCRGALKRGTPTSSGVQDITYIPERDLYRLIMRSRLPEAEQFEEWVVSEVLPTIRKTGGYGPINLDSPAQLRALLLQNVEKVIALEKDLGEAKPKLDALERISESDGSLCVTDAAKALQVQPKALFSFLAQHGWIYKRAGTAHWLGYQAKVLSGLLEHKVTIVPRPDGSEKITEQVRVTPKGLSKLAMLIKPVAA